MDDLARLIGDPQRVTNGTVSCEHNCLTLETAAAEMEAVAAQNARVKNPVYHFLISWPGSESPTDEQAFACARHALAAVGMEDHQYVFAIHRDTEHPHVHIAVNRVHPESFRAVYPYRDHYKLSRAMRELELQYGWSHDNGSYAVFERNGQTVIDWASKDPNTKEKKPSRAQDMERHADQESLFSYAHGKPRRAVLAALKDPEITWQKLHQVFAKYGLSLREKGQGLAVYDAKDAATTPIKASDMSELLGKNRLVKRLGEFEAQKAAEEEAKAIQNYNRHRPPKRNPAVREERRQARARARRELRARYERYRKTVVIRRLDPEDVRARFRALYADYRQQRLEIRTTVDDPAMRRLLYHVASFQRYRAEVLLKRDIRLMRKALRDDPTNRRLTWREWVQEQAMTGDDAAISQLRGWAYQEKRKANENENEKRGSDPIILGEAGQDPIMQNLPGLRARVRRDGAINYRMNDGQVAMVDQGDFIQVCEQSDEAILAAFRLARERFGETVRVVGTPQFRAAVQQALQQPDPTAPPAQKKWDAPKPGG